MTLHSRRSALGLLGATGGLLTMAGPGAADTRADLRPGGRLDRFVADRAAADQFSGTVLVAHRNRPVLTRSHGMADKSRGIANDQNTAIDLASMTKSFTAIALTQLVQQGKVALHAPLGNYLDGFPTDVARVTIHQLLTHTAGAGRPGLTNQRPPGEDEWDSETDIWQGMLAYLRTLPLRFTPGSQWSYSNDGYFLLGAVTAAVAGVTYYDYVRRNVFAPAGLTHTDFYTRPQVIADRTIAHGYLSQPTGDRVDITTTPYLPYLGSPYHGAFSSAPDLLRFATALHGEKLLNPAHTHLVTSGKHPLSPTDRPAPAGQLQLYGYGHVETIAGKDRIVGHSGSGPGRSTNIDVFPDAGWVVIVLSNYDTSVRPIVELAQELVKSAVCQE